ncbi:MAG TPA: hypothetical protein VIS74_03900 [Chthoniobacterales bacterium]
MIRVVPFLKTVTFLGFLAVAASNGFAAAPQVRVIADFEKDAGGFSDGLVRDATQGKAGKASGKVETDLSQVTKSAWTTIQTPLKLPYAIEKLSFWVKTSDAKLVMVRIIDATGQTFQVRMNLAPNGQWQQVVIDNFAAGQSFGGAKDKRVHWPARNLAFIIDKNSLQGGKGTLWFDQIEAVVGSQRIVGKLDILTEKPGNVFLTGENVQVAVDTQGDAVKWSVKDFWGKEIGSGTAPVTDQRAVIPLKVPNPGYYEVQLAATKGGAPLAEGITTLAVLTPFDLAKVKNSPFGIMTHFAQGWDRDVIPLAALAGIKDIRDELYWANLEKTKGQFSFPREFDAYMAAAKAANLIPLTVLSFGNKNYDDTPNSPSYGNAPYTDAGRAAYTRYCLEVLKHYGSQIEAAEIWNEYNGTFGKGPVAEDKAKYYFEMLKTVYGPIKQARPDLTVVGVSAVTAPIPYFEDLFKRGALKYMNALSFHPYRTQSTPEGLEGVLKKVNALVAKYNGGKTIPLWITELGWYVKGINSYSDVIVTEVDQAKYLVRAITLSVANNVEKFYWYHLRDDRSFPSSGVLRSPEDPKGRHTPKPSYAAYANLIRQLNAATFVKREPALNEGVYSMLFNRGGEEIRVLWSLEPVTLTAKAGVPLTVVDLMGVSRTVEPSGGVVNLPLTDIPVYVFGSLSDLPPVQKAIGELVADSEEEFSSVQGDDGWSYGIFIAPAPGAPYDPAAWQQLPKYRTTIWGYEWIGDQPHLFLTPGGGHPGRDGGKPIWVVRRWISDVEGNIRFKGLVGHGTQGDGTTGRIFVDGKEVWKQLVGGGQPNQSKFDFTLPIKKGAVIDIAVDPGPGTDTSFDGTTSNVTLTLMP